MPRSWEAELETLDLTLPEKRQITVREHQQIALASYLNAIGQTHQSFDVLAPIVARVYNIPIGGVWNLPSLIFWSYVRGMMEDVLNDEQY